MSATNHSMQKISRGQQIAGGFLRGIVGTDYLENYRPEWLFGMELDFYFESLKLAVEFNGDQHYHYTGFGAPQAQQARDKRKRALCAARGITLVRIKAIDLQFGTMRCKLKRAVGKANLIKGKKAAKLNAAAIEYRKQLIRSYDSPTARKKGSQVHIEAVAKSKAVHRDNQPSRS